MTWNAFHHRGDILRAVVEAADQRLDGHLPLDVPGAEESFEDETDLIGALSLKWHARLSGNIERALATEPIDLESAVARAWHTTAQQLPGVRLVIDRATQQPDSEEMDAAMRRARRAERVRLAQAAGLANDASELAARTGERIEEYARAGLATAPESTYEASAEPTDDVVVENATDDSSEQSADRASFVRRIKAVLAA